MWAHALFGLRHAHFEHAPIDFWRKHPECPTNEHGVNAFPSIQYAGISALGSVLVGEELPSNAREASGGGHLRSQMESREFGSHVSDFADNRIGGAI